MGECPTAATSCGEYPAFLISFGEYAVGGTSWSNRVRFDDGTTYVFSRRERPHLVFGDAAAPTRASQTLRPHCDRYLIGSLSLEERQRARPRLYVTTPRS